MKNGTVAFLWFASLLITWNLAKKQTVDVKAGPSSLNNYSESRLEKETVGEAEIPSGSPGSRRILVQNKTEKSPDAEALWRQLRIEVIPAGSRVSYREFFELWNHLNNLNDLELLAIIKTSHTKEYSDLSRVVNRMALSIIGENNPKAAFPLLEGLSHDAKEMSFMNLIEGWSEVDPENTLEWLESSDPLEMSAEHYTTVFMKLARKDLDLALKSFESIDVNCKVDAFKGICGQFKSSEDFHLLLENFSIHTNSQLVEVLADSWSLIDPQAAIAWGQNLDPENRKDALYTVKYRWLNNDPHSAAEWITHNSVDLKEDIAMVITHWNSLEAVDWLKSLPIENELDRDHGFISHVPPAKPEA